MVSLLVSAIRLFQINHAVGYEELPLFKADSVSSFTHFSE